eukprot:3257897-Pyramimonas_sp.AAC.1
MRNGVSCGMRRLRGLRRIGAYRGIMRPVVSGEASWDAHGPQRLGASICATAGRSGRVHSRLGMSRGIVRRRVAMAR